MHNFSIWEQNAFLQYDCITVGAGITGLCTAIRLKKLQPKLSIAVLECGFLPSGASTRNAGFACFGSFSELVADAHKNGAEAMVNLVAKRWQGLKKLRQLVGDKNLHYKQHGGYELIFKHQSRWLNEMERLNSLLQPVFDDKNVFTLKNKRIVQFGFNTDKVQHLIYTPFEGQIHSGFLMHSLLQMAAEMGIHIATGAEVQSVNATKKHVDLNVKCGNQNFKLKSKSAALCSNAFVTNLLPEVKIQPGRGQVMLTKPLKKTPFIGNFHFDEGFYYFRNLNNCILFGGGRNLTLEEENTEAFGGNPKIINDLKEKLQTIIMPDQKIDIESRWSGIMGFTADKKPIIKKIEKGLFVAAGLSGMGIAIGAQVGEELAEKIIADF